MRGEAPLLLANTAAGAQTEVHEIFRTAVAHFVLGVEGHAVVRARQRKLECGELLAIRLDTDRDSSDVRALAHAKIKDIDQKIQTLQRMKKALGRITERCTGCGPASECPILESIDSDEVLQ